MPHLWFKVVVCIICGCAFYVGIYGTHMCSVREKTRALISVEAAWTSRLE